MSGVLLEMRTGVKLQHVPYRATPAGIQAVANGEVTMGLFNTPTVIGLIKGGKLKAIAVTSEKRSDLLPEVPTMTEVGLPQVASLTFYGLLAPAGTPEAAVRRVNAAVNESLASPDIISAIRRIGFDPHSGTPEDFTNVMMREMKVWTPIVQSTGFQMN